MAVMNIYIEEEIVTNPVLTGTGVIGGSVISESPCTTSWEVSVKTQTSVWVEWTVSQGSVTIIKTNNNQLAVNGETITSGESIVLYSVVANSFRSWDDVQNTNTLEIAFILRDSQGGSQVDKRTFTRFCTTSTC
jgi:hypothetical protein